LTSLRLATCFPRFQWRSVRQSSAYFPSNLAHCDLPHLSQHPLSFLLESAPLSLRKDYTSYRQIRVRGQQLSIPPHALPVDNIFIYIFSRARLDSEQASLFFPHIILTQNYSYFQYFYTPSKALGPGYRLQHLVWKDQVFLLASAYIRYPLLGGFEDLILLLLWEFYMMGLARNIIRCLHGSAREIL